MEKRRQTTLAVEAVGPGAPWLIGRLAYEASPKRTKISQVQPIPRMSLTGTVPKREKSGEVLKCSPQGVSLVVDPPWGRDPRAAIDYAIDVIDWIWLNRIFRPTVSIRPDDCGIVLASKLAKVHMDDKTVWTKVRGVGYQSAWDVLSTYVGPTVVSRYTLAVMFQDALGLDNEDRGPLDFCLAIESGSLDGGAALHYETIKNGRRLWIRRVRPSGDPVGTDAVGFCLEGVSPYWSAMWDHTYKLWMLIEDKRLCQGAEE